MSVDRFTDGKPRTATQQDCQRNWGGGRKGEYFRCAFCGYKFKPGDYWRWQYTNDMRGAGGNPIVCKDCDEGPEATRLKWKAKVEMFMSEEWWWFHRDTRWNLMRKEVEG